MQNYIVLEITRNAQGNIAVYPSAKETESAAWKKYFQVLENAVDSQSPLHAGVIMGADGFVIEQKAYTHEPQPEPDAE